MILQQLVRIAVNQKFHTVEAGIELLSVTNRALNPTIELATAHGGAGSVKDLEQGVITTATKIGV